MQVRQPLATAALLAVAVAAAGSASVAADRHAATPDFTPALVQQVAIVAPSEGTVLAGEFGAVTVTNTKTRQLRATSLTGALHSVALPGNAGALGIPELVLAAYRNAELAMAASEPGCGLPWNLLAGIGKIESNHASGGMTDPAGTTVSPIFGPSLDGTLPGNEVIRNADGSHTRAVGPMQFLPSTWEKFASDGNRDGTADPNNIFDAALGAGKYLCTGGGNLKDRAQELQAVLRYNHSMKYAADVIGWSNAYRTGGSPTSVALSPDLIAPGSLAEALLAAEQSSSSSSSASSTTTTEQMITIAGLPPFPCGVFCMNPPEQAPLPAPAPPPPPPPPPPPAPAPAPAPPGPAPADCAPGWNCPGDPFYAPPPPPPPPA